MLQIYFFMTLFAYAVFFCVLLLYCIYCQPLQETKNPNLYDKNCTQENVKCHIQHEESWLRWILIEKMSYK